MKDTGQSDGQYLYAVIACTEPREFTARGIGERGDVVHTVNYRRLAAVVSNSPNVEYESSRRNMMAHTLVLEEVMEQFDLLPVRFGALRRPRFRSRRGSSHHATRSSPNCSS